MTIDIETSTAKADLAPTGALRVGVVTAPTASTFFVAQCDDGAPRGVTVALGSQLAGALNVRPEIVSFANSGQLTDALETGDVDIAFMPVDAERKGRVDFGASYFLIESTALTHGDAQFITVTDLDQADVHVVGIENTTTLRSTVRALPRATVFAVPSVAEALRLLQARQVDALVLSRDVLESYCQGIPGSRVLDGRLHSTAIAIATQKGRAAGLAYASRFLEGAKASGAVRKVFDEAGFRSAPVAPPGDVA